MIQRVRKCRCGHAHFEAENADVAPCGTCGCAEFHPLCYDCGRPYGHEFGFPDLLVPREVWLRISPTGSEGGLLCPSCICKRAHDAGLEQVPAWWGSGPLVAFSREDAALIDLALEIASHERLIDLYNDGHAPSIVGAEQLRDRVRELHARFRLEHPATPVLRAADQPTLSRALTEVLAVVDRVALAWARSDEGEEQLGEARGGVAHIMNTVGAHRAVLEHAAGITAAEPVTRFEVIDHRPGPEEQRARVFAVVNGTVVLSYQDGGRTLKVFVTDGAGGLRA